LVLAKNGAVRGEVMERQWEDVERRLDVHRKEYTRPAGPAADTDTHKQAI
jgi:hypothetical protein